MTFGNDAVVLETTSWRDGVFIDTRDYLTRSWINDIPLLFYFDGLSVIASNVNEPSTFRPARADLSLILVPCDPAAS